VPDTIQGVRELIERKIEDSASLHEKKDAEIEKKGKARKPIALLKYSKT
jgi:hypothetical protein